MRVAQIKPLLIEMKSNFLVLCQGNTDNQLNKQLTLITPAKTVQTILKWTQCLPLQGKLISLLKRIQLGTMES